MLFYLITYKDATTAVMTVAELPDGGHHDPQDCLKLWTPEMQEKVASVKEITAAEIPPDPPAPEMKLTDFPPELIKSGVPAALLDVIENNSAKIAALQQAMIDLAKSVKP